MIISVLFADYLYYFFANPNFTSFLNFIKLVKIKLLENLKSGKKLYFTKMNSKFKINKSVYKKLFF